MKLRHYQDSPLLIVINMLLEYGLLVGAYFLSGVLRKIVPYSLAQKFGPEDILAFLFFGLGWSALCILVYFVLGDYKSLHFRSRQKELFWILILQFTMGIAGSGMLFWVQGSQFSRVWLMLLILTSTVLLWIKRVIFCSIAARVFHGILGQYRVLIVGGGDMARRYYEYLCAREGGADMPVGYLAEQENPRMDQYLGTPEELYELLHGMEVDRVILAPSRGEELPMQEILSICNVLGIPTFAIPVFNDYLIPAAAPIVQGSMCMYPVSSVNTSNILGVNIAVTSMDKAVQEISDNLEKWKGEYICVSNVHTTVMAHDDNAYRAVQNGAIMALPDGGPLSAYSRSEGIEQACRVTGPDLMREILKESGDRGWTHFFYGSSEKTLEILKEKLAERYPGAKVVGMISPPFREITPKEDEEFVRRINEATPDFLWVGLGAPKQENWMAAHKGKVNALMLGVGAAFDYESDNIKRAPAWMQKLSLEWLYRLLQDPKRLFKRYFVTNIKYLWLTRK